MNFLTDPLFTILFDTAQPRFLIDACSNNFNILARNKAAIDVNLANFSLEEDFKKSLLSNKKIELSTHNLEFELRLSIMPINGSDSLINYLLITVESALPVTVWADKAFEVQRRYATLHDVINHIPMGLCILYGEEMNLKVVNQGMLNLWGRDISILNKDLLTFMPELVGQEFPGILQQVYNSGEVHSHQGAAVDLMNDGAIHKVYMDYSYTPLYNLQGQLDSILVIAEDVSERELSKMRELRLTEELTTINEEMQAANEELAATNGELINYQENLQQLNETLVKSENKFRQLMQEVPVAIALLKGPHHELESANDQITQLWGKANTILNKPLTEILPELQGQHFISLLDEVYKTGESYYGSEEKAVLKHEEELKNFYLNFVYQPVKDADGVITGIMVVATDVSEQVASRHVVEESEGRLKFLLNAIPQQVWTADSLGRLNYVNQVVVEDFGQDEATIVGLNWKNFIHPDDLVDCLARWSLALETGEEYLAEFRLRFADGSYCWHLARAVPLIERGKIQMWVGTNTNISLQKEKEYKKDEFLSIASHELKTPLTSIKAFTQLMLRNKDADKQKELVKKSIENITRLERLINDLLDVTKINAGKMNYNMELFSFRQMLEESIANVQHTTSSHQIELEPLVEMLYLGDAFRLEQVVNNFLANAIKYSPEGDKVLVRCKLLENNIIVSVQDFGIGIAKDSINRLFERYYRVDNLSMRFEGLGLGLFISSEILKRHGGSFWIESNLNEGSTFHFRLPLHANEEPLPVKRTSHYYKDPYITISYDEERELLYSNWIGFQNIDTVKRGCLVMLEMLKELRLCKVINNNSLVLGTWSEASDWAGQEWLPQMEAAGLTHFAWIYSPSVFSQLSAQKSVDGLPGNIATQFFTDHQLAEEWIQNTCK